MEFHSITLETTAKDILDIAASCGGKQQGYMFLKAWVDVFKSSSLSRLKTGKKQVDFESGKLTCSIEYHQVLSKSHSILIKPIISNDNVCLFIATQQNIEGAAPVNLSEIEMPQLEDDTLEAIVNTGMMFARNSWRDLLQEAGLTQDTALAAINNDWMKTHDRVCA